MNVLSFKYARAFGLTAIAVAMSTSLFAASQTSRELKEAISQLSDLNENIKSIGTVATKTGIDRQVLDSDRSLARAGQAFAGKQWLTVIQELQVYFSLEQKPDAAAWMKAQYMIGRSYEERGQGGRAARAYLRYLSTFVTARTTQYEEMTDVLERLVRISTKGTSGTKADLRQFLSSIAAMDVPSDVSAELKYLTAVGGANIGQKNLALTWLNDLSNPVSEANPRLKARTLLFKALLAMQDGKWESAETALQDLQQLDGVPKSTIENARVSLARVYLRMKKPRTAIGIYESIKPDSESYREALFEKTFTYIRLNESSKASASAAEYLNKFGEQPDAMQIRVILSWLDLRNGDLIAAKQSIQSTQTAMDEMRGKVSKVLSGKEVMTHEDATTLVTLTKGEVPTPVELEDILSMFEQVEDLQGRLSEVDGIALNALYAIAKSDLERYKPALANRMLQLEQYVNSSMGLAQQLIKIESNRLENALSDLDKQKLKSSANRRALLAERHAKLARQARRWINWSGPAEQLAALARVWNKFNGTAASLTKNNSDQPETFKQLGKTRQDMLKTLTDIRREQAADVVKQSRILEVQYVLEQLATSINDDELILTSYEPEQGQTLDILDDEDSQRAWRLLNQIQAQIHRHIVQLNKDAEGDLAQVLKQLDDVLGRREKLSTDVAHIQDLLQMRAGSAAAALANHFEHAIGERLAKQQKWSGDLDYLTYVGAKNEQEKQKKSHDLEIQILSDNLRDQQQGTVTQWPR